MTPPPLLEQRGALDRRSELPPARVEELKSITLTIADALRAAVNSELTKGNSSSIKSDRTVVTAADVAGEKAVRALAAQLLPEAGILGEEQGHTNPDAPFQFVTDPVDGTLDLTRGIPTWGSILALYYCGHPLVGVIDHPSMGSESRIFAAHGLGTFCEGKRVRLTDSLRPAVDQVVAVSSPNGFLKKGNEIPRLSAFLSAYPQTRMFYTCYSQTAVALGKLDLTLEWNVRLWDIASLRILIEEAGGKYHEVRRLSSEGGAVHYTVLAGSASAVAFARELLENNEETR
jgi:fructose-1,6-bisphosphatase/inositol monophosphatase family enzyme